MITFKEFLVEVKEKTPLMKMNDFKRELITAAGLPRGRVRVWISGAQSTGVTFAMHIFMHNDDDPAFFLKLVEPLVKKLLAKHFDRFEIEDLDTLDGHEGNVWTKKMVYARVRVPDKGGQL